MNRSLKSVLAVFLLANKCKSQVDHVRIRKDWFLGNSDYKNVVSSAGMISRNLVTLNGNGVGTTLDLYKYELTKVSICQETSAGQPFNRISFTFENTEDSSKKYYTQITDSQLQQNESLCFADAITEHGALVTDGHNYIIAGSWNIYPAGCSVNSSSF